MEGKYPPVTKDMWLGEVVKCLAAFVTLLRCGIDVIAWIVRMRTMSPKLLMCTCVTLVAADLLVSLYIAVRLTVR